MLAHPEASGHRNHLRTSSSGGLKGEALVTSAEATASLPLNRTQDLSSQAYAGSANRASLPLVT
ncbi:MAG: hypothetical protein V7760_04165 [Marinobacter sp.]